MANSYFAFKHFTICQDKCAMKVGTDSVMLGAWVDTGNKKRILDVGTGTGLLALMCAQRSNAAIDAVELDENAYLRALANIASCPWKERISVWNDSFQNFATNATCRYDLIISNPPYFRNSLKPLVKERILARHDENLSYETLLFNSSRLLISEGTLALVVPASEMNHLIQLAYFHKLFPVKKTLVRPYPGKKYSRCMIIFNKNQTGGDPDDELIIRNYVSGDYTDAFRGLTREFYL